MASDRELDRRPDPDALLALAGREGRGKLKVFLGAAPGVGKTYAMLLGARRLKAEGSMSSSVSSRRTARGNRRLDRGAGNPAAKKNRVSRAGNRGI